MNNKNTLIDKINNNNSSKIAIKFITKTESNPISVTLGLMK